MNHIRQIGRRYLLSDIAGNAAPAPFCSVFVTTCDSLRPNSATPVISPNPSLGLRIERGTVGNVRSERILAYLAQAENKELDPWLRDDYRVAWLTVLRCAEGHPDPWRYSFWTYYGIVPEKALERWAERDREREAAFAKYSLPPKKPVSSVRLLAQKKAA